MDHPSPASSRPTEEDYVSAISGEDDLAAALQTLAIQQHAPTASPPPAAANTTTENVTPRAGPPLQSNRDGAESPTRSRADSGSLSLVNEPPSAPSPPPPTTRRTAVIFQDACMKHRYTRNSDIGSIVERPERIRAIKTGVAAAWVRLEGREVESGGARPEGHGATGSVGGHGDSLSTMMKSLGITEKGKGKEVRGGAFDILFSTAVLPADDPAVLFVHPLPNLPPGEDPDSPPRPPSPPAPSPAATSTPGRKPPTTPSRDGLPVVHPAPSSAPSKLSSRPATAEATPPWPLQLQTLCRNSPTAIKRPPFSEIPPHLPQGDLYLSEGSEEAIFGALGAVCEGVDRVVAGSKGEPRGHDRIFVGIRPPGHHCCEALPMGFCFVNNVAVAAAHAHQRHGIDRVIILDIDLHHGNGTQDIVWRINAAANHAAGLPTSSPRKGSPRKAKKRDLAVCYASLHDIFSYPCEEGDPAMVQAASLNLSGGHSQYISNTHLQSWDHESEFYDVLYPRYRDGLLGAAAEFCKKTAIEPDESARTLVIVSAGFDASEHESAGMSRHRRNVPTSFYARFARDVVAFANTHAAGKVLAVLEGGYSDRALASGTLAFMTGLVDAPRVGGEEDRSRTTEREVGSENERESERGWWDEKAMAKLEKACKARRGGKLFGVPGGGSSSTTPSPSPFPSPAPKHWFSGKAPGTAKGEDEWLARTVEIFSVIDGAETLVEPERKEPNRTMQLRERRPRGEDLTPQGSPQGGGTRRTPSGRAEVATTARAKELKYEEEPLPVGLPSVGTVVQETREGDLDLSRAEREEASVATVRTASGGVPKIRFTWKEGGYGADPREAKELDSEQE